MRGIERQDGNVTYAKFGKGDVAGLFQSRGVIKNVSDIGRALRLIEVIDEAGKIKGFYYLSDDVLLASGSVYVKSGQKIAFDADALPAYDEACPHISKIGFVPR